MTFLTRRFITLPIAALFAVFFTTFVTLVLTWSTQALAALPFFESKDDGFLPVEEAYKVDIALKGDQLLVTWIIEPEYYLYRDKFALEARTPETRTILSPFYEPGEVKWDDIFQKEVELYYNSTVTTANLTDLADRFELKLKSQGCAEAGLCYPPRSQYFQIDRTNGSISETDKSTVTALPDQTTVTQEALPESFVTAVKATSSAAKTQASGDDTSLALIFVFALAGGIILNLMPCVFPVLSLKALSFASSARHGHRQHAHGWAYTVGVIVSFILAGLVIIALRSAGNAAGWGFQLQSPIFVAFMAYLFLVMGLSLSGMVYFGTGLMGVGQKLTANDGLQGSFFTGVLAALVASPCTGPLMAPALGYALTQSAPIALAIFAATGLGLALPFLLITYSPAIAKALPQPGQWMETLKQFLAFPMYITAAWLLYVFGNQVGVTGAFAVLVGGIAIAFAIWVFQLRTASPLSGWLARISGGAALVAAIYIGIAGATFKKDESWQAFTPTIVRELRNGGQPVFVDFTADWCITCKLNERVALDRKGFREAVKAHNYAIVKGDWTNEDPHITQVLEQYGRSGVPLYLVFPADPTLPAEVLPQLLTQSMVIAALERNATKL